MRQALLLAVFVFLAGPACRPHAAPRRSDPPTPPRAATGCALIITPAAANRFFDQLVARGAQDGCALEGVQTNLSHITLRWTSGGRLLPAAEIDPTICAPPGATRHGQYSLTAPPALRAACPRTLASVRRMLTEGAVSVVTMPGHVPSARPATRVGFNLALVVLVALIFGGGVALEFSRRARRWGAARSRSAPPVQVGTPDDKPTATGSPPTIETEAVPEVTTEADPETTTPPWLRAPMNDSPAARAAAARTYRRLYASVAVAAVGAAAYAGFRALARTNTIPAPPFPFDGTPWLLLAALIATAMAFVERPPSRSALRIGAALAGLTVATFVLRQLVVPISFFHQNGQGPLWIAVTIRTQHHPYGSGYRELFGWAAWLSRSNPDAAVFTAQAALAALAPACAWIIARRAGARPLLAWAFAIALVLEPCLCRMSRSETYYSTITSLLLLATAALGACAVIPASRLRAFALPAIAAGLIIAQTARVQPVGWIAAALTPVVLLLGPGSLRRRLRRTAWATAIVAVVVLATAGPQMYAVLTGHYVSQWAHQVVHDSNSSHIFSTLRVGALAALGAAVVLAGRPGRLAVRAAVGAAALFVMAAGAVVDSRHVALAVCAGYERMYVAALVAVAAGVLTAFARDRRRATALACAVVLLGAVHAARSWRVMMQLPTDTLEQLRALSWRRRLPEGARVMWLQHTADKVLALPLYGLTGQNRFETVHLTSQAPASEVRVRGDGGYYYYRSSLCSTLSERAWCEAVERRMTLVPVEVFALPRIQSVSWQDFAPGPVRVGLYRAFPAP